ncbi:unnamed protein product [Discosporangium mesarthrocarpum]
MSAILQVNPVIVGAHEVSCMVNPSSSIPSIAMERQVIEEWGNPRKSSVKFQSMEAPKEVHNVHHIDNPPTGPDPEIETDRIQLVSFLQMITFLVGVYSAVAPWAFFYDPDKKEICPYRTICATSTVELALLSVSRFCAGALSPSVCILFLTKCSTLRSFIEQSWVGSVITFEPTHDIHLFFGIVFLYSGVVHSLAHTTRYIVASEPEILYDTQTGRSGVLTFLLLLPVALPMNYHFLKKRYSYEIRKAVHFLAVPLLITLAFHSPAMTFVCSIILVFYIVDTFYFMTKRTFLIHNPKYTPVGRGTHVSIELPEGYKYLAGAYIYVNCPMISRKQWHAFSIIPRPTGGDYTSTNKSAELFCEAVGDWTSEMFRLALNKPRVPLWITAPLPSLMERSLYYQNVLLIGTGAGITPAVSIVSRYCTSKNIHLLWMSRDTGLIALFEEHLHHVRSTVHVTGKPDQGALKRLKNLFNTAPSELSPISSDSESEEVYGSYKQSVQKRTLALKTNESNSSTAFYPVNVKIGRPNIDEVVRTTVASTSPGAYDVEASMADGTLGRAPSLGTMSIAPRNNPFSTRSERGLRKVTKARLAQPDKDLATEVKASSHGELFPWVVLYCGANPKVMEAIDKVCTELGVKWSKEYFGEW